MTAKQHVQDLLNRLPEDTTLEDIEYHLHVYRKIQKGLEAADRGEVVSHEEAKERMAKWRVK